MTIFPSALPLVDGALLIDNSSLERIVTCPRSAEYYILKKREQNKDRAALKFGKIIHKILEKRELVMGNGQVTKEATTSMMHVADEEFQKYTPPDDEFRNYQMAIDVIVEYNKAYPNEPHELLYDSTGRALVEVPFVCPLGEITLNAEIPVRHEDGSVKNVLIGTLPIVWTGRIDKVCRREGKVYFVDRKTTTMMGPSFFKEFDLSSQFVGYTWALCQLLGIQVEGGIVDAIAIRKPTRTGEKISLERHIATYTPGQIEDWKQDVMCHLRVFLTHLMEGFFPKSTKHCIGKYGECQFYNVCVLPSHAQREQMLATAEYKNVTWSPLNNESD